MEGAGNIILQLIEVIGRCRFGICYFSEKGEDGRYFDNPNVIFEAGMFHGKTSGLGGVASAWIPIREKESPDPFFDIAQERIVEVERDEDGGFQAAKFEETLRRRVGAMIEPEATL